MWKIMFVNYREKKYFHNQFPSHKSGEQRPAIYTGVIMTDETRLTPSQIHSSQLENIIWGFSKKSVEWKQKAPGNYSRFVLQM